MILEKITEKYPNQFRSPDLSCNNYYLLKDTEDCFCKIKNNTNEAINGKLFHINPFDCSGILVFQTENCLNIFKTFEKVTKKIESEETLSNLIESKIQQIHAKWKEQLKDEEAYYRFAFSKDK